MGWHYGNCSTHIDDNADFWFRQQVWRIGGNPYFGYDETPLSIWRAAP